MPTPEERLAALERMEKRVKRRLLQGRTEEVIPDIRFIITQYRELKMLDRANTLEAVLNQFITESLSPDQAAQINIYDDNSETKQYSRKEKREALGSLHRE